MALESASWISDLDPTNPPGTDKKKQGDDHLRMIKDVLKRVFPNASKAFYLPTVSPSKTASFSVVAGDMNKVFLIDTGSTVVTATLPTLTSGDAGWECSFIKTNTGVNPYYIAPPSGSIQSGDQAGLAKTRRCIPGSRTRVLWTGAAWIAERVVRVALGAVLDVPRTGLAVGYEFANSQVLSTTDYPDYAAAMGSGATPDRRGRCAFGRDDMGASDVDRLQNTTTGDTTVGATGGAAKITIDQTELPGINLPPSSLTGATTGDLSASASGNVGNQFFENFESKTVVTNVVGTGTSFSTTTVKSWDGTYSQDDLPNNGAATFTGNATGTLGVSFGGSVPLGGSNVQVTVMPPMMVTNLMVVVE